MKGSPTNVVFYPSPGAPGFDRGRDKDIGKPTGSGAWGGRGWGKKKIGCFFGNTEVSVLGPTKQRGFLVPIFYRMPM